MLSDCKQPQFFLATPANRPILPRYDQSKVRLSDGKVLYEDQVDVIATGYDTISVRSVLRYAGQGH